MNRANADDDTDTSSTVNAGNGEYTWDLITRSKNSLGLLPPSMDGNDRDTKYNKQDCIDNRELDFEFTFTGAALQREGDVYLMLSLGDVNCDEDNSIDQCEIIAKKSYSPTAGNTSETVLFTNLELHRVMGIQDEGICLSETERLSARIWIGILQSENQYDSESDLLDRIDTFMLDFTGPAQTTAIKKVLVGEDSLEVQFAKQTADAVKGFVAVAVPVTTTDCADGPLVAGAELDAGISDMKTESSYSSDETNIKISGLDKDTTYQVAVATVGEYGNPSKLSAPQCASPQESIGIGDAIDKDGEYCFIATAAFGDYDHPTVRVLRTFRDRFLRDLPAGEAIIAAYYSIGPSLAGMIQDDAGAKDMLRNALGLFAQTTTFLVAVGPLAVFFAVCAAILMGLIFGLAVPRAREK
ncbi:MAG: hypothetical protein JXX14_00290 [Deltaproteobacteria bacterium]|nr:hypothetical protein [Deltaproteobacteria bacterium]